MQLRAWSVRLQPLVHHLEPLGGEHHGEIDDLEEVPAGIDALLAKPHLCLVEVSCRESDLLLHRLVLRRIEETCRYCPGCVDALAAEF